MSDLANELERTQKLLSQSGRNFDTAHDTLPFGFGLLLWGLQVEQVTAIISQPDKRPAAIWLFAPRQMSDLGDWSRGIRQATDGATKVWIQVGTVADALTAVREAEPDVLVVQGQDAGGHGLTKGAGLIPLLPEVTAAVTQLAASQGKRNPALVAAGGVMDGTCAAAALALGADGLCLGTRLLGTPEANVAEGYRQAVLRAKDGGATTVRSHVYDTLRGTTSWPSQYGGRGVVNASFFDHEKGMDMDKNKELYNKALEQGDSGWNEETGRLTTYAGTGVGLVQSSQPAAEVIAEVRRGALTALRTASENVANLGV